MKAGTIFGHFLSQDSTAHRTPGGAGNRRFSLSRLSLLVAIFANEPTHDCTAVYGSNTIVKFADDTTVIGLISNNDESAYREEVQHLAEWCANNNLALNTKKTKELIVDFRRTKGGAHTPICINGTEVERVASFKFLGVHISEDLSWTLNTSTLIKKAHQRLFFLRRLKKANLSPQILVNFYRCTIESILTNCISVWYGSCSVADRKTLQRVVKTAQLVPHSPPSRLSSAKDVCGKRAARRTAPIPTTDCLPSSPQGGATGSSVPGPAGSGTASSLRLSPC